MSRVRNSGWTLPAIAAGSLIALAAWQLVPANQPPATKPDQPLGAEPVAAQPPANDLAAVMAKMKAAKAEIARKHNEMLAARYDLAERAAADGKMTRGKAVQQGPRAKLVAGTTWAALADMKPEEVREKGLFPVGYLPLPHPNHPEGGMLFPKFHIDEIKKQEGRDLTRFDLDYDLPDHFLPEFPPPIFLTTRLDLGDISKGKLITIDNFEELFKDALNPKQLEGLRLLVTPFPQQQFNMTADRRSEKAHRGVTCFDCHVNGHTNAATHLVGDIRPQEFRHRIDVPSLRGVNVQRLFGSQRALKSIEDFTEFEQRAAYFDGDHTQAARKGVNPLDRGSQVHFMAEFQDLLDFPPAPKLDLFGKLDQSKATDSEKRGEALFNGKAKCSTCHPGPYYTDNTLHNLQTERFFKPVTVLGRTASVDGPIKTFPLRGIKDSPPYLHDGRLLTLEDTVEFFNLILETKLTEDEKKDLVAFMKCL
ncbi:cytochrome b6 : Cytochrome c OS=Myxococcus stipitatus (strain DSM 14675 / JCM 12634 / Mx s8) GN=MYSTI_01988 PE=4 SV=1 [Gemmata massiliana]|uniref:Cytochrome b6: Cytochrome c n=1 Tax=Gemmata massiliana TaxID=1210884 RepID=A0A6P2DJR8_9BACT|nr:cytochrome B6 [Gemmata massiliana]VTS03047.1 cytochrome b6 : Cytochrome c OS=Myxococcus stipitatus (strain DSM 14675 / JCM 12634 / Mx s8) GN=MYSTI_01988 PE=4 SV=1 [Gemmata massiliana]